MTEPKERLERLEARLWQRVDQWRQQADADREAAKVEPRHVFRAAYQVSADMHEGFANGLVCDLNRWRRPMTDTRPLRRGTKRTKTFTRGHKWGSQCADLAHRNQGDT